MLTNLQKCITIKQLLMFDCDQLNEYFNYFSKMPEKPEDEVEAIIGRKVHSGKVLYQVKWVGYPVHQATWENVKSLKNVKDKINQYVQSLRQNSRYESDEEFHPKDILSTDKRKNSSKKILDHSQSNISRSSKKIVKREKKVKKQKLSFQEEMEKYDKNEEDDKNIIANTFNIKIGTEVDKRQKMNSEGTSLMESLYDPFRFKKSKHIEYIPVEQDNATQAEENDVKQSIKTEQKLPSSKELSSLAISKIENVFNKIEERSIDSIDHLFGLSEHPPEISRDNILEPKTTTVLRPTLKSEKRIRECSMSKPSKSKNEEVSEEQLKALFLSKEPQPMHIKVQRIYYLERREGEVYYLVQYGNGVLKKMNTKQLTTAHPQELVKFLESKIKSKLEE